MAEFYSGSLICAICYYIKTSDIPITGNIETKKIIITGYYFNSGTTKVQIDTFIKNDLASMYTILSIHL